MQIYADPRGPRSILTGRFMLVDPLVGLAPRLVEAPEVTDWERRALASLLADRTTWGFADTCDFLQPPCCETVTTLRHTLNELLLQKSAEHETLPFRQLSRPRGQDGANCHFMKTLEPADWIPETFSPSAADGRQNLIRYMGVQIFGVCKILPQENLDIFLFYSVAELSVLKCFSLLERLTIHFLQKQRGGKTRALLEAQMG